MAADPTTIEIRSSGQPAHIRSGQVHFTFADGRFGYDCIRCGSKCCRGYGYLFNTGEEMVHQLRRRPHIAFFVDAASRTNDTARVKNCPPGCFFLNPNGLCSIQVDHGYAAKPETCRLFPFNAFRRVGSYLVVAPHADLCPLDVVPPGMFSPVSSHDALLDGMRLRGIGSPIVECGGIVSDIDPLMRLERSIVTLAEAHLDAPGTFPDFCDAQASAAATQVRWDSAPPSNVQFDADRLLSNACRMLGLAESTMRSIDSGVHRTVVAMTPYLRSQWVFRPLSGPGAADNPPLQLERVPAMILAVYMVTHIARQAGMAPITFQTVTRLFQSYQPLIWCLAHADQVMTWRNGTIPLPLPDVSPGDQRRYIALVKSLLPNRVGREGRPLAELLCEHGHDDATERFAFLHIVTKALSRSITPWHLTGMDSAHSGRRVRAALQRWAVHVLPDDVLERACARQASWNAAGRVGRGVVATDR